MADWIKEGTAHRSPIHKYPVRHLLVDDCHGGWALWCSSGKGRPDSNPHSRKFCHECTRLACEAIADETLDASDVNGWPIAKERA
jgi:hypothetical protein